MAWRADGYLSMEPHIMTPAKYDSLTPHKHDPNPLPPSPDPNLSVHLPDGSTHMIGPADLYRLASVTVPDCYIVSSGHGTSGPFAFSGVRLLDLVARYWAGGWSQVEVSSGDGFGTRVSSAELTAATVRPILCAYALDGRPLSRSDGLVRLIVPNETDDALRQVKWMADVYVIGEQARQNVKRPREYTVDHVHWH